VNYGLAPRPELSAEELAAVVTVAEQVFKSPSAIEVDNVPSWRFSGRWFDAGPYALRRPHRSI